MERVVTGIPTHHGELMTALYTRTQEMERLVTGFPAHFEERMTALDHRIEGLFRFTWQTWIPAAVHSGNVRMFWSADHKHFDFFDTVSRASTWNAPPKYTWNSPEEGHLREVPEAPPPPPPPGLPALEPPFSLMAQCLARDGQ